MIKGTHSLMAHASVETRTLGISLPLNWRSLITGNIISRPRELIPYQTNALLRWDAPSDTHCAHTGDCSHAYSATTNRANMPCSAFLLRASETFLASHTEEAPTHAHAQIRFFKSTSWDYRRLSRPFWKQCPGTNSCCSRPGAKHIRHQRAC